MLTSLYFLFYVTGECHNFYTEDEPKEERSPFQMPIFLIFAFKFTQYLWSQEE